MVQHYPIIKPYTIMVAGKEIKVDQEIVDKMSDILVQETTRYSEENEIIIWDSFQALMDRYGISST